MTTTACAATTQVRIAAGTIVLEHRLGRAPGHFIEGGMDRLVTMQDEITVEATREADGSWRYAFGRWEYFCAGGLATPVS